MKRYVGAIDQGTTGTRFILVDKEGKVCTSNYKEHRQIYPKPGWVEHDANEIWENTRKVMDAGLIGSGINPQEVASIGITNQRETFVAWNPKDGTPYCNAIVWQDTRSDEICERLKKKGLAKKIADRTGLPISVYFSAPKIQWLFNNVPQIAKKAKSGELAIGTIDSWLLWKLTFGRSFATDHTNASRTMLMNLRKLQWDRDLLEIFGIPESVLPAIKPSISHSGYGYAVIGTAQIPINAILGDQQAALFGHCCFTPGDLKVTYGTGNFLLMNTGKKIVKSKNGLLSTAAYSFENGDTAYALEGSVAITGAVIQWLRDNLGMISSTKETEELASRVPDSGGVYFVPAFSGLFAPYWDATARGIIVGLTRFTKKEHIVRAAIESIAYQTADVIRAMESDCKTKIKEIHVDGGASSNGLLMRLQAEISRVNLKRPHVIESTARGAAFAAGLACGFWKDMTVLKKLYTFERFKYSDESKDRYSAAYKKWHDAIHRCRSWL